MIAFVFICLAVVAAPSAYRSWKSFDGEPEHLFRLVLSGLFLVTMVTFGVFSFVRAKKISRTEP